MVVRMTRRAQGATRGALQWASRAWCRRTATAGLTALLAGAVACSGVADGSKLPPNVQDPATLQTPSGAVARYRGALAQLGGAFDVVMSIGGIFTDELAALRTPRTVSGHFTMLDARMDLTGVGQSPWNRLHRLRGEAREARGFVSAYVSDVDTTLSKPALRGHLYAAEAYAEVLLADLFCSGIPLSTVDFEGNYTLAAGSTTRDVYRHAVALFDSALALTNDSARVQQFAAVGKGRALLALGEYAAAAAAVGAVPDGYAYEVTFAPEPSFDPVSPPPDLALLWYFRLAFPSAAGTPSVADREGQNGLDYRTSGDPRTAVVAVGEDALGNTMYFPAKYPEFGPVTFALASGVEARLIEAEAALQANAEDGQWLAKLNVLRQSVGLADTTDPGTTEERVDLLFRERAFWLFLTGHRQGDLRRLVRNYGRAQQDVYPTGQDYPGASGSYGNQVVLPAPESERELNAKYTGCFGHDA